MKKFYSLFVFLFLFQTAYSQYTPIDTADNEVREKYVTSYKKKYEGFNNNLKSEFSGKLRNKIIEAFTEAEEELIENIETGQFVYDKRFSDKVNEIVSELKSKNTNIPQDLEILISKYNSLNAYNLGEGTLVVNMGAFYFLDNEDQLAGIISHEIAHQILEHVKKTQLRRIQKEMSGKNKATVKQIKNQKYNRSEKAFQVFRDMLYEEGTLRRQQEREADSLGYMIFRNAKYENAEFTNALKLFEYYDTIKPTGLEPEVYKTYFDLPNQPFDENWLNREDFSVYDYSKYTEKIDLDSLSTHPEVAQRISYIQELFPELKENKEEKEPSESFFALQEIAKMEQIPNLFFAEQYGVGIYNCLLRLQREENEEYYKEWLGKLFQKIYEGRKTYRLNRYLDTVNPKEQSESYQQFLDFMWNLSLTEIKNIADYYTEV